jgi:hypothetical protein
LIRWNSSTGETIEEFQPSRTCGVEVAAEICDRARQLRRVFLKIHVQRWLVAGSSFECEVERDGRFAGAGGTHD